MATRDETVAAVRAAMAGREPAPAHGIQALGLGYGHLLRWPSPPRTSVRVIVADGEVRVRLVRYSHPDEGPISLGGIDLPPSDLFRVLEQPCAWGGGSPERPSPRRVVAAARRLGLDIQTEWSEGSVDDYVVVQAHYSHPSGWERDGCPIPITVTPAKHMRSSMLTSTIHRIDPDADLPGLDRLVEVFVEGLSDASPEPLRGELRVVSRGSRRQGVVASPDGRGTRGGATSHQVDVMVGEDVLGRLSSARPGQVLRDCRLAEGEVVEVSPRAFALRRLLVQWDDYRTDTCPVRAERLIWGTP